MEDDVEEEEDEEAEDEADQSEVQRPPQQSEAPYYNGMQHPDVSQMGHADMSYSNNMPVADMLTPSTEVLHQAGNDSNYFQSGTGLALPQPPVAQQSTGHPAGLVLPQAQPQSIQEPLMTATSKGAKITSPKQNRKSKATTAAARRSLPARTSVEANISDHNMDTAASQPMEGSSAAVNTQTSNNNSALSSSLTQQAARNQQRSRQPNRRMATDSPQLNDSMAQHTIPTVRQQVPQAQQSPRMLAAMQAQARTSPLQNAQQRTDSRQGQRGQSRTPNADQNVTMGYKPLPQATNDLVASSNHSNLGCYSNGNAPATGANNRIAYEPYSWQQSLPAASNSYPAFDYSRNTSASMSMNNPSTMATSYNSTNSTNNQWSGSQSRSSRTQDRNAGHSNTNSYQQNAPNPASLQSSDMRGSAQKRVGSGSINKQDYPQYGSQQSQEHQMGQPGWNNFNYSGGNQFGSTGSGWM